MSWRKNCMLPCFDRLRGAGFEGKWPPSTWACTPCGGIAFIYNSCKHVVWTSVRFLNITWVVKHNHSGDITRRVVYFSNFYNEGTNIVYRVHLLNAIFCNKSGREMQFWNETVRFMAKIFWCQNEYKWIGDFSNYKCTREKINQSGESCVRLEAARTES